MVDEVQDLINIIYQKNTSNQVQNTSDKILQDILSYIKKI